MTTEKIINRVQKMLAIANDLAATEHERDTALQMAYKVLAKHNISMAQVEQAGQKDDEPRGEYDTQNFSFKFAKQISNTIAELFFCKLLTGYKINGTQCKYYFIGKESNAATAMVMSDYVIKSVMKEGRKLYKQNTSPECRSFCMGAAARLYARVKEMKATEMAAQKQESTGTDLVLASLYQTEADANNALIAQLFPNVRESKSKSSTVDAHAYHKGAEFAKNINLSLQVGASKNETLAIGG